MANEMMTDNDWKILARAGITPEGLHVGGSLVLSGCPITALPEGLHVGGSLILSDTKITALPDGLHVGWKLYLSGTEIPSIHTDSRGYDLRAVKLATGWCYVAGCRTFKSADAALAHWGGDDYPDKDRGEGFCDAIHKHMESVK